MMAYTSSAYLALSAARNRFSWPQPLSDEALHGLAGQFLKVVEPHTEADPACH